MDQYFSKQEEVIPVKPEVTNKDNPLSILHKFQQLHQYNLFNAKRKIKNINNPYNIKEAINVHYDDMYQLNKSTVAKKMD